MLKVFYRRISLCSSVAFLAAGLCFAQSTTAVQGTITDESGANIPNATITATNVNTGESRTTKTDASGLYVLPSLPVGSYRMKIEASGMETVVANDLRLEVGRTVRQDFKLKVASVASTVEITATPPLIDSSSIAVGAVIDQRTVQEIPLNGRHFVDLALLIPGSVTPPQNGFLTAPLRGQGSFAFNTAGNREDTTNFMINGINMNDMSQNQITFQPTINTVEEFKVDNSTFSAQYGRNSGAIVNIATRSGTNTVHGEVYEFLRNNYLDARNFGNPVGIAQSPFKRNQFGADGGGPIVKDKTFVFLSYEGLVQRQGVPLQSTVLSSAQRARAANSDPVVRRLVTLIPEANSPGNVFLTSATAPVNIHQGTANFSHSFSQSNRFNAYYAMQHDLRAEPPTTQNNTLPGYGDTREGWRQLLTLNDTAVISPTLVNEARAGFNRIHIVFAAANTLSASDYGINSGVTAPIGLPQINIGNGLLAFGGINNFPQGRGDNSLTFSDTVSWQHNKHSFKFGAEYRRVNADSFAYTPGTFSFASIDAFLADQASSFTVNTSNRSARIYVNSIGAYVQDAYKITPRTLLDLGLRWDWNGTPTEAQNRFVVFNPTTTSLQPVGKSGGLSRAYNQNALNFGPRVGFTFDPFGNGKTVVRTAYAIFFDQPITGLVGGLVANPPNALPVSFSATATGPTLTFANAYSLAGGVVSPTSVAHNYKNAYVQSWNFNVQQDLGRGYGVSAGYYASKGTNLNIARNYNQPVNGILPYRNLSASDPFMPGARLGNIVVYESVGNSSYNGLWVTGKKRFGRDLQFDTSYTFARSIDLNSRNVQGVVVQDSYNLQGDRGLSDFDVRHRWVFSSVYQLPFRGNRLVEGWQFSVIEQIQSGNPVNFRTTNTALTGLATFNVRPNATAPIDTGYSPAVNGNPSFVKYIQNPAALVAGSTFGNLGRNVAIGPGFSNLDFALVKNTRIRENLTWQVRADAFDLLNQANFGQPGLTVGQSTLGVITNTRFPPGDSGSSRQLQLAMKLIF